MSKKNNEGFMSIEWLLGIGLLIIPVFILTFSLMQYPPRKSMSQSAAAEAAKAYTQASSKSDAIVAAKQAAKDEIVSQTSEATYNEMLSSVGEIVEIKSGKYCPGENITIEVKLPMPLIMNPFSDTKESLVAISDIKSTATERIDDHRDLNLSDAEALDCPGV